MTRQQKSELQGLKQAAIDGMVSYMRYGAAEIENHPDYDPTFDAGYSQEHVDRCSKIVDTYLDAVGAMRETGADPEILSEAKKAVTSLNNLNEVCGGSLIETDQREQICRLMITAAKYAGLTLDGDFTEEWREW